MQVAYCWVIYDISVSPEMQEQNNEENSAEEDSRIIRGMVFRAESGSVDDQIMLGNTYRAGYRVRRDMKQAEYWYQQAADTGSAEGQYKLAKLLHDEGIDLEYAVKCAKRAALQGHANGQALWGDMLLFGRGCTRDLEVAERLLLLAADQENGYAMISLATLQRARANTVEATHWLLESAKLAITDAFVILGERALRDGDLDLTMHWYGQVVDESLKAQFMLAMIYMHGPTSHLDQPKAVQMFRDVAKACKGKRFYRGRGGFVEDYQSLRMEALHELGHAFMNGDGVDIDKPRACLWYKVAAQEGYADSQVELAKCYLNGDHTGVRPSHSIKSFVTAVYDYTFWVTKADLQGHREAKAMRQSIDNFLDVKNLLNADVENDLDAGSDSGVDSNHEPRSCRSYKAAADKGHADSQVAIAKCYLAPFFVRESDTEEGTQPDYDQQFLRTAFQLGKSWLTKAAGQGHAEAEDMLEDMAEYEVERTQSSTVELDEDFYVNR